MRSKKSPGVEAGMCRTAARSFPPWQTQRSRSCRRHGRPDVARSKYFQELQSATPVVTIVAMDNLRSGDGSRESAGERSSAKTSRTGRPAALLPERGRPLLPDRPGRRWSGAELRSGDLAGAAGSDRGALASCCGSIWLERRCDFREYRLHVPGRGDRWRGKHWAFLDDTLEPDPLIRRWEG